MSKTHIFKEITMLVDVNHEGKLRKDGYGQYNTATCWLSCYRMLYKWAGKDEDTIPSKLAAAGLNYKELCQRGIYGEEFPVAGSALGMCGWEGQLVKVWDDEQMVYALKGYGPLYFTKDYGSGGHALLIVGFTVKTNLFKIYNPYNQFEVGTVEVDYATPSQLRNELYKARWALQAWFS
jgi:hypothetical protein